MLDVCVGTSVGTITEPDCLGPCEPGTSVTLEGIVWHETEGGKFRTFFLDPRYTSPGFISSAGLRFQIDNFTIFFAQLFLSYINDILHTRKTPLLPTLRQTNANLYS